MNRSISRVAVFALLMLAALVVATTYWQTLARAELAGRQDNAIQRVVEFTVKRGEITSRGALLARNRAVKRGARTFYFRRYPRGPLTAHVVGYSTVGRSRAGLERSLNDYLTGANQSLSSFVDASLDKLKGT
jgi:penicillin-binding protein A